MIGGTAVFENVSEYLDEAVRLADRCPEKYQVPCFEALIRILASPDSLQWQIGDGYVLPLDRPAENPLSTKVRRLRRASRAAASSIRHQPRERQLE